jgi:MoxR-like ATPase
VLLRIQEAVRGVHVADTLLDYTLALIARTRSRADLKLGLSPRAGQGLVRAAQAWAYLENRKAVLPEDIQAVLPAVVAHRLEQREGSNVGTAHVLTDELLKSVPVPL